MIEKDPSAYPLLTYMWVIGLSFWGGLVSYFRKRKQGLIQRFSIVELIGEMVTSSFAGIVTFFFCQSAKVDPWLSAALIAISGHMGTQAVYMFEGWLKRKFGEAP